MGREEHDTETVNAYDACQLFDTTKNAEESMTLHKHHQFGRLGNYNGSPVMLGGASSEPYNGEMVVEKLKTIDFDSLGEGQLTGWSVEDSLKMTM